MDCNNHTQVISVAVRSLLICFVALVPAVAPAQTLGEALNATNLTWTTSGNSPWFYETNVTHDGVAAAQNGAVTNKQFSVLQTTITGPCTLMFWWEIAHFDQGPCKFTLAIDGVEQASTFGGGWRQQTNYLGDGDHLVQWVFTNFLASGTLQDAGIVDEVSFIPSTTAPAITIQPMSQSQASGLDTTFTVTATGTPPLSYHWRFNGTNVPGAQASLFTVTNMQSSNSGTYQVIVSNVAGGTLSSNADLSLVSVASWPGINNVPPGTTNVLAVAVGEYHALALRADGTVVGWGSDSFGQATAPIGLTNAIAIAAGQFHSLALKADGTVIGWGRNDYDQTSIPAEATNSVAIAAGGSHSLVLRADGTVVAWGDNTQGESNIPNGLSNVVAISSGLAHNMALRDDGRIIVWGWNYHGITNVPSGLTNAVAIAAGFSHNLALTAEGTVVAWGDGYAGATNMPAGLSGVLGISGGTFSSLAVKTDGAVAAWGNEPPVPSGLKNVSSAAAGGYHNLAIVADGPPMLHAWMQNPECSAQGFSVRISTQSGRVYRLEYLTSVGAENWTPLPLVAGNGRLLILTDPMPNDPQRFYRIRQW